MMNAIFDSANRYRLVGMVFCSLLLVSLLPALSGCTRRFFRRRADAEVDAVLAQKTNTPAWKLADYYVYPHPLSRFADPTDPDRPPMPPDDPAAWDLSPHPQRPLLKGYKLLAGHRLPGICCASGTRRIARRRMPGGGGAEGATAG